MKIHKKFGLAILDICTFICVVLFDNIYYYNFIGDFRQVYPNPMIDCCKSFISIRSSLKGLGR